MRNIVVLYIAVLLILPASAQVFMQPNPMDINVRLNEAKAYNFTITNNLTYRIKSFTFSNLSGFTFPDFVLESNETRIVPFSVNLHEYQGGVTQSTVSFKYLVDIPATPQTLHVNMTANGFTPEFLVIHEGDTVVWHNSDDISHTVTSGSFDLDLPIGETVSQTFTQSGSMDYQDLVLFWTGTVQILNRSSAQEVNNPANNFIWNINMNVITDPTVLSINLVDRQFNVEATSSAEGLISVQNTGNTTAQRVKFTADSSWVHFDENDFSVEPTQTNFVTFKVQPVVFTTNETNKTYDIHLTVSGLNTQTTTETIQVFIPYTNIFEEFDSNEGFLNWFNNVFCPQNQQLFICNTTVMNQNPKVIIKDPDIPINLTATQVYAMLKRIQSIQDSNQRTNNRINTLSASLETEIPKFNQLLNESVAQAKESEEQRKTNERVFWIIGIFAILIVGFLLSWGYYEKIKYKRRLMGIMHK
ncbi:hypothetical protein M0R04_09605 [Candidatus Dojkabacteria bacterium]|jgi:plastocyanin|nr:hypothetical protein [Candidatus Dojkabacteria bacterium]